MKESRLKARRTKVMNNLKTKEFLTSYEKQALKKKSGLYIDARKRID